MDTKQKFLSGLFNWIQIENSHRDLIFICGSKTLRYHQAIVAPHSKLLSNLVQSTACCDCKLQACPNDGDVVITLDTVDPNILDVLMKCVYTGNCENVPGYMLEDVDTLQELLGLNVDLDLLEKIEDADDVMLGSPNAAQFEGDLKAPCYVPEFKGEFKQESADSSMDGDQEGTLDEEFEMEEVLTEANQEDSINIPNDIANYCNSDNDDDSDNVEFEVNKVIENHTSYDINDQGTTDNEKELGFSEEIKENVGDNSDSGDDGQGDKEYNYEEDDDAINEMDETGMTEEEQVAYAMQLSMVDIPKDGSHKGESMYEDEKDGDNDGDEALLNDSDKTENESDLIKENISDSNVIGLVKSQNVSVDSFEGGITSIIKKEEEFEKVTNEFEIEMVPILIKRSYVWIYFGFLKSGDNIDSRKIICTICQVQMSYKKNTKRMSWHLENIHNIKGDSSDGVKINKEQGTIESDLNGKNVKDETDIGLSDVRCNVERLPSGQLQKFLIIDNLEDNLPTDTTLKNKELLEGIDKSSNQSTINIDEVLSQEEEEPMETIPDQASSIFQTISCRVDLQRIPSAITQRLLSYAVDKTNEVLTSNKSEDIISVDSADDMKDKESNDSDPKDGDRSLDNQDRHPIINNGRNFTKEAEVEQIDCIFCKESFENNESMKAHYIAFHQEAGTFPNNVSQNQNRDGTTENIKKINDTNENVKKLNDAEYDDYVSSRLKKLNSIKYSVSETSEKEMSEKNTLNTPRGKRKSNEQIQHQPIKKSLANDNDIEILTDTPTRNYNLRQSQESKTAQLRQNVQLQQTKKAGVNPINGKIFEPHSIGTTLLPTKISATVSLSTKSNPSETPSSKKEILPLSTKTAPTKATIIRQESQTQQNKNNFQHKEIKQTKMAVVTPMGTSSINKETALAKTSSRQEIKKSSVNPSNRNSSVSISQAQQIEKVKMQLNTYNQQKVQVQQRNQPQTKTITNMKDPQLRQQMQIQAAKNSEFSLARANQLRQSIQTQQFKKSAQHQATKQGNQIQPIKSSSAEPNDLQKKLAQAKITEQIQQLTPKPSAIITRRGPLQRQEISKSSQSQPQILKSSQSQAKIIQRSPSQPSLKTRSPNQPQTINNSSNQPQTITKAAQIVRSPSQPQILKPPSISVREIQMSQQMKPQVSKPGATATPSNVHQPNRSNRRQIIPQPNRMFSFPNSLEIRSSASNNK